MSDMFEQMVQEEMKNQLAAKVAEVARQRIAAMMLPSSSEVTFPAHKLPKTGGRICNPGAWLALSPKSAIHLKEFEAVSTAAGYESRRVKAYKIVRDLLLSGPASRAQLTKLVQEQKLMGNDNSVTSVMSWMVKRGLVLVVARPSSP